jgi:hypothetical protein
MLFKYYGVDWAIFAILVLHLWLLGNKVRAAFLLGMLGSSCGIVLGYMCDSVAVMIMNAAFICMHFRAWLKWTPVADRPVLRIAEDTWPENKP